MTLRGMILRYLFFMVLLGWAYDTWGRMDPAAIYKICSDKYKYDRCTLLVAMAYQESSYDEHQYNPEKSGSFGLLQIQCKTAKELGLKYSCDQLFNPTINVRFGVLLLKDIEERGIILDSDIVASYNGKGYPQRCKEFNTFKWGRCYPGQYVNQWHVNLVMEHYNYLLKTL